MIKDQRIRDPIHDLVGFSSENPEDCLLWELLQTAPVQRLRRIKQLGFSEFVYPGATHTRFSHVIGAMHMARRMLAVFERNRVFKSEEAHRLNRMATLSAALLHDIGHGPYSHVFEEISEVRGISKAHEEFTLELLAHKEINSILEKFGISKETANFFGKESGYDPYSTIISSQMDCDRLDFLVRDRYHTGIQSAHIDLEWLFDSLRIERVPLDPLSGMYSYCFVLLPKGISVAEEFVLSYMKMYQDVYFHKTTRAVQHLVTDVIKASLATDDFAKKARSHPLGAYFTRSDAPTVAYYLSLDDSSVVSYIHFIAEGDFGDATRLADRYLRRDLYKCLELPMKKKALQRSASASFITSLNEKKIEYMKDIIPSKSYKQYDVMDGNFLKNILVKTNSDFESLGEISDKVKDIPANAVRIYFKNSEDCEHAKSILQKTLGETI